MRSIALALTFSVLVAAAGCSVVREDRAAMPEAVPTAAAPALSATDEAPSDDLTIVVAPSLTGRVDEALVRDAYRRAADQGERDFGIRPQRPVTVYVDPDSAAGLEDALGLSAKYAIHLRAGRAQRMETLLPLMMHEYMHVLQYSSGRLRPQWWIEGQAEHQGQRLADPARAQRDRRSLLSGLAADIRSNRAPSLASLRGNTGWDEYIRRSGAGRAYGWGNAAVAFIEDGWGFEAVARVVTDADGPNTLSSFDEAVRRETGLDPTEFEQNLRSWILKNG